MTSCLKKQVFCKTIDGDTTTTDILNSATVDTDSDGDGNADDAVYANLMVGKNITINNSYSSTPNWNIVVSTSGTLTWTVTGTYTNAHTLTWDPSSHTYTSADNNGSDADNVTIGEAQTITVHNNSNFDVTPTVAVVEANSDTESSLFGASFTSGLTDGKIGNNTDATATITPDLSAIKTAMGITGGAAGEATAAAEVKARAKFTFARGGASLYQYSGQEVSG